MPLDVGGIVQVTITVVVRLVVVRVAATQSQAVLVASTQILVLLVAAKEAMIVIVVPKDSLVVPSKRQTTKDTQASKFVIIVDELMV